MNKLFLLIFMSFITNLRAMEQTLRQPDTLFDQSLCYISKHSDVFQDSIDTLPAEVKNKYVALFNARTKQISNQKRNTIFELQHTFFKEGKVDKEKQDECVDMLIWQKRAWLFPMYWIMLKDAPFKYLRSCSEGLHGMHKHMQDQSFDKGAIYEAINHLRAGVHDLDHQYYLCSEANRNITQGRKKRIRKVNKKINDITHQTLRCINLIQQLEGYNFSKEEFEEIKHAEVLKPLLLLQKDSHLSEIFMQYAIEALDQSTVEMIVDHGFDCNKSFNGEKPPLFGIFSPRKSKGMQEKQKELLLFLLERGAHPDQEYRGSTPLSCAITTLRPDLAQCLVAHGANTRFQEKETQYNYLHLLLRSALEQKHYGKFEEDDLIQRFADILPIADLVNEGGSTQHTPLHDAVSLDSLPIVRELVENYGADVNVRDINFKTCADYAHSADVKDYLQAKTRDLNH